ncbi:MAG: hypothetical protein IPM26_13140 [Saprospiraceae bacterium]|nr:hypothetical protein [Saprospiraceae bacterium]
MKSILVTNAWVEGLAGIILIFRPDLLLYPNEAVIEVLAISRLYGVAALTMGIFSWVVSKGFSYTVLYRNFILMIMAFHLMVTFHMYSLFKQAILSHPGAFVFHLVLLIIFGMIYLKNAEKFNV